MTFEPSWLNAARNGSSLKKSKERSLLPSAFQRVTALSRPHETSWPSCPYATASAPPPCAFQVLACLPSDISHHLTVPSSLEEARSLESSRQLSEVTKDLWPGNVKTSWPFSGSHITTPPLRSA